MSNKLKVMFSTHGLVEGDYAYDTDEKGFPSDMVVNKKVITGQDTGGQVYYVKALASVRSEYQTDLVTRRVDPRICPQFGGQAKDLGSDINYTIEEQWHQIDNQKNRVLRVPTNGNFNFIPKEEIVPQLPELVDKTFEYYKENGLLQDIKVVEGHYRDGMLAADMMATKVAQATGTRPVMIVTSHSLGHKKYERNLKDYEAGKISQEEWAWHGFEERIKHEIFAFNKADIIIATSPDEKERLLTKPYNIESKKIVIIPPGYNSKIFTPKDKEEAKKNFVYKDLNGTEHIVDLRGKKVVSSLGRVVRDKGFVELSKTMAEIIKKDRNVVYMVSAENNNPVTKECEEILKDVRDNVIFLPSLNQTQMAEVYNTSDIFVMSSLNEAFGMVPIEAMGCKTSVVVGRSGFNDYAHCADIRIKDQDFTQAIGLYGPSQDVDRWRQQESIELLLNNDALRNQIAENGYNFVRHNLTWEAIAKTKDECVAKVAEARENDVVNVAPVNVNERAI